MRAATDCVWPPDLVCPADALLARAIEANHGGGYQYRLCKADDPLGLTEECFFQHPLPFTNSQRLRWGGKHGRVEEIEGRLASDGVPKVGNYKGVVHSDVKVLPPGSAW